MATSDVEAAWLAGLLEGEGSFWMITASRAAGGVYRYPKIVVSMTDEDVIDRVSALFGNSTYVVPAKPGRKQQWRAQVSGAAAAEWMRVLYPWLGARRRAKIDEVLSEYRGIEPTASRRSRACSMAAAERPRDETTGQFLSRAG